MLGRGGGRSDDHDFLGVKVNWPTIFDDDWGVMSLVLMKTVLCLSYLWAIKGYMEASKGCVATWGSVLVASSSSSFSTASSYF